MKSHNLSETNPLPNILVRELATSGVLDEISNHPGAVRNFIFHHGVCDKKTGKLQKSLFFAIYQTGRHGPQNGYRLCLVHKGFHIASATKHDDDAEDDIDRAEKPLRDNGHEEMIILGQADLSAEES